MPALTQRKGSSGSCNSYSRRSSDSCGSQSTAPTSICTNPGPSEHHYSKPHVQYVECDGDLAPNTSVHPRSSVDTYASTVSSEEGLPLGREEDLARDHEYDNYIPPLPSYRHEIAEPNVRPSTPKDFAQLFPSRNRLSIRHDDFTSDGNMNLRVDTDVPGKRRTAVQLFHLRMYDLARREFSLRRYCRESGREVCNSKRKYVDQAAADRPNIQRSVSSAMKAMAKPQSRRSNSSGSNKDKRPSTSHSYEAGADFASLSPRSAEAEHRKPLPPMPTNTIKLEFSNYAGVEVERKGQKGKNNKRYEFKWWGHNYAWKRVVEKHLDGVVSFHLIRDGESTPVAHIVPEIRSPNQVEADEEAGGWVPPCYMWINDPSVLEAVTDVADVIIATGLMALVDDCIKERWQAPKVHHLPVLGDVERGGPRSFMQRVFSQRSNSSEREHHHSPTRHATSIPAY
ncbi:hypothetical protein VSDG_02425 [Cytospora chrysosperma]|uniref:Uncharacterized protein n=1 Tax=Cytospora chrysosperma TaxID=252740 RepID=A0A423WFK1_CYTCH|nr:hypothetical protein VSDG_02425 [Valsa sordida]